MISQAEYARRRGFSKQYVGQLVARGKITLVNGLVDATAADQALAQSHDPARYATRPMQPDPPMHDPAAPGLQHSFAKARTIREHFRALREKLDYETTTGTLIPRQAVEAAGAELGRIVRDEIIAAAGPAATALAQQYPAISQHAVQAVILDHLSQALHRIAEQARGHGLDVETTEANPPPPPVTA
jgi:hypothetical protein